MKNSEILKTVLETMEKEHINLYHSVSKKEIEDYVSTLTNLDELSQIDFDCEMLKLFAKFKDAHTMYYIPKAYLDKKLVFIEKKVLLKDGDDYKEVKSIGNMEIKDILKNVSSMISYETKAFLRNCLNNELNNQIYYHMLKVVNEDGTLDCVVDNDGKEEHVKINPITRQKYNELGLNDNSTFYSYEIKDNIITIKYKQCLENKDYPFTQFVEEIKQQIQSNNITQYILDLRGNFGGKSDIIHPLTQTIKDLGLNGALLIDNGVFSAGRWAVADFKREFNTPLIGEPTGGAAASYGNNKNLIVDGKMFSVSQRYFDLSEPFGGEKGSIQPDILVPKTIEDLKNNKDTQLLTAIDYLIKQAEINIGQV